MSGQPFERGQLVGSGTERLIGRVDGAVGWLLFNNPDRRNAVSRDMWDGITRLMALYESDPAIRVIVLAGVGGKAFVSGADLTEYNKLDASEDNNARYRASSAAARAALAQRTKPCVAMIDGFCIGAGMLIAVGCDVRIASDRARFAIPATRLGLGYGFESVVDLVHLVGPGAAKDILFSARQLDAEEALRIGLVSQMVSATELEEHVAGYAGRVAENAPLSVHAAKLAVDQALKPSENRDTAAVIAAVQRCLASADYTEGRRAFQEKRAPRFTGN